MFHNLRLWIKIMVVMGATISAMGAVLTYTNLSTMQSLIAEAEKRALDAHMKTLTNSIAAENRMAESMSALIASIPLVAEKFYARDREALSNLFVPGFKLMSKEYGVEQFQFHTPLATSFLRVHQPEKFGDDLSSFRHTVVTTNKSQKPARGLEGGVAGLGARGMVPVMHNGQHVGSVEFGMTLGQPFFEKFKAQNGVNASLHVPSGENFKTIASTLGKEPLLDSIVLHKALAAGDPQLGHRKINGVPHAIYVAAINNFSGKPIGVLEIAMDSSAYEASLTSARTTAVMLGILALIFGLGLAMFLARHLVRRINTVVQGVNRMAQGDFSQDLPIQGNDEIGELAHATRQMQSNLHGLAVNVGTHATAAYAAAREINGAVESLAATSTEMSWSVVEITSTMEELSASSIQVAEHSLSVVNIASKTRDDSHKGFDAMQTVLDRMDDIRADNQQSLQEIMDLGEKSQQISKVMEIINTIADQTRLIAFNAAIEASSAGEAGKRFSVVAAEIRRLADNVTTSTNEIEARIDDIQNAINRLVVSSEKGAMGITAGMEASTFTAGRLNDIVIAANQTTSAAEQISLSTQEQMTASNQVSGALREILTASTHTDDSINRLAEISKEMSVLSGKLSETVGHFKI